MKRTTPGPQEWTPLFQAFAEALEWALDLASGLARPFPTEIATVERLRTFVRKRISGDPAHVRVDDVLFTLGLIAGALERDVRPALAPRSAPLRTLRAAPRRFLRIHHQAPPTSLRQTSRVP